MLRSVYKFLASLKLAVVLLLSLAAILAAATYYESVYDAKTASHLVYGSWWFYLFLFMLGVNVACAAAIRYPWQRRQTGFVVTHLGIITILVGSFITAFAGFEGTLALRAEETGSVVTIDKPMLSWQVLDGETQGHDPSSATVQQQPAEFRWSRPSDARPRRFKLDNGLVVLVDRYYHSAVPEMRYEAGGKELNPAIQVKLDNAQVHADEWMALADPDRQEVNLGPATLRFLKADSPAALERLLSNKPAKRSPKGILVFGVAGARPTVEVEGSVGKTVPLEGTPYRVRVDRFLPYAVVDQKRGKLISRSNEMVNPAVELTVLDSSGAAERHIVFARFPEFSTTHQQERRTQIEVAYTFEGPDASNGIDFILGPGEALYYRVRSKDGKSFSGPVKVGAAVQTHWRMKMAFTVAQFLPRARVVNEFREFHPARGKEGPPPAIRVRVEGADDPGPYWIAQGSEIAVRRGKQVTRISYHLQGLQLGFKVMLKKFTVGYDPGTRNAASYSSDVTVTDPARQAKFDQTISMNEPLHYNGVTLFQASFQEVEGGSPISVLQIANDPGVPVKYAGSILLCCGIAIMFFINPMPKKRAPRDTDREVPGPSPDTASEPVSEKV
ncbi:MAG: cytochrome c biogenesis protein ResB [Armatimonadetes bacterium]|nr:cytochrome c biogenesis protein ResB [Armatimonadota bacterium]